MTLSATPHTFSVERDYGFAPSLVFAAFASLEAKKVWYGGEGTWEVTKHTLDFRVGGTESWRGRPSSDAPWMTNDAIFYDIVPDARLIFSYVMTMNEKLFTVSQQVAELLPSAKGTLLKITEQILYIDGVDHHEDRVRGTEGMLVTLEDYLKASRPV